MSQSKTEIITFKVEPALAELIHRLPNKSDFIRNALLSALESSCPLCQGTGVLTPKQKDHWNRFAQHHQVEPCGDCDALHLHCDFEPQEPSEIHRGVQG